MRAQNIRGSQFNGSVERRVSPSATLIEDS